MFFIFYVYISMFFIFYLYFYVFYILFIFLCFLYFIYMFLCFPVTGQLYCNFGLNVSTRFSPLVSTDQGRDDCKMIQDRMDDHLDWTLHSGPTPSTRTGPPSGHTSGRPDDLYVYVKFMRTISR